MDASSSAILSLVEIKDVLSGSVDTTVFLQHCCPWLLPSLFLYDDNDELEWIPRCMSLELSALVWRHFASIFGNFLPLHSHGNPEEQHKAGAVLQRDMLAAAQLIEDEHDTLICNQMIAIVNFLFRLCGDVETPHFPHLTRGAISSAVQTVVDGFLDIDPNSQDEGVVDKIMNPPLKGACPSKGGMVLVNLLLRCVSKREVQRPSLSEIVATLQSIQAKHCNSIKFLEVGHKIIMDNLLVSSCDANLPSNNDDVAMPKRPF